MRSRRAANGVVPSGAAHRARGGGPAVRYVILNLKSGVGRETSAVSLTARLQDDGSTLLIDVDPQDSQIPQREATGKKRIRITLDLDPEMHRFLKVYAAERGLKVSEVLRKLIESLKGSQP